MEILVLGGLGVILLGWLLQFIDVYQGRKELNKDFLIIYALGVMILAYDGYGSNNLYSAALNFGCLVMAALTIYKLK